jgi:hypothetical protein
MRTAKSCGPDAPTLASSSRKPTLADDGGKRARSPGRARSKPLKPLRGECRAISGVTVVTNARVFYTTRAAAGALGARHSLHPLDFRERETNGKPRAKHAARSRSHILTSLRANGSRECAPDDRLREAIQSQGRRMDCFVASLLAMTEAQSPHTQPSSPAKAGDPVFQRR